jgi:peptide/nickel transport system substrate-binding protein
MSFSERGRARSRKSFLLASVLAAFALLAAACADEPERPGVVDPEEAVEGGTVVFGADQEPAIMNPMLEEGNLFATTVVTETILEGAYMLTPDFEYVPWLIDGDAEVTEDPFTVTYNIHPDAAWADGTPITAEDWEFTWETIMNEDYTITSRDGYDQITQAEIIDDKTIRFHFDDVYAPWRNLFSVTERILPKHELEGEDFNTVWNDEITLGSGPFEFDEWRRGSQASVVRNDNYWGENNAYLDEIIFRFIEDSAAQIQQLRGREIDMLYPQPELEHPGQIEAIEAIEFEVSPGTVWEHLDFQLGIPPLDQLYVRQAIAHGIDREAIVNQLILPIQEDAEVLQSVIYVPNQDEYEPAFDIYDYDPDRAVGLLEENGCTRGGDGIYECEGERLSFNWVTTAGNERRELTFEIVESQLREIGVEIEADFGDAAEVFGRVLPTGQTDDPQWALFNFAWVAAPDPVDGNTVWQCVERDDDDQLIQGFLNYTGYCSEEVTDLIRQTDTILDPDERAAVYNRANELIAQDLPVLPLYQWPLLFAWYDDIVGPIDNPTLQGPTWNAGQWYIRE